MSCTSVHKHMYHTLLANTKQYNLLTLYQPMTHICVMSVLLFFHKSIRINTEVIILGANTLYSVFCFFKALLPQQVWSGMVNGPYSEQHKHEHVYTHVLYGNQTTYM